MKQYEECAVNEERHPAHGADGWVLACILSQVAGQQGTKHIGAQIGYKDGGAGVHTGSVHESIYGDAEEKAQYEQQRYGCLEREQQNKQRINVRDKNRKARGFAPPAQGYLIEDKHLQQ